MSEQLFRSAALDEPPLPPQYVERLVAAGRASVRRRRAAAVLCVLTVLVAGLALVLPGPRPSVPAVPQGPAGPPSLPERIAPYSTLTSTVSRSPGGRAVMLYQFGSGELFNLFQPLALGADRDTYRQLDAAEGRRGIRPWLLSPDGTTAVVTASVDAVDALTLVDLRTGRRRSVPLPSPAGALPLAFSPDGRTLAYAAVPMPLSDQYADVAGEARRTGVLVLTDLDTGRSSTLSAVTPVFAAAFSPDGQRIAVQTGPQVRIVDRAGTDVRTVELPAEHILTTHAGWSPDGRLLAATGAVASPGGPDVTEYHRRIVFVDATGAGGPVPEPLAAEEMLGWRAPDRVVAQVAAGDGPGELRDLPVAGGPGALLSRFDPGSTCELGLQTCQAFEIRMATGLLPALVVRPADADRGPWPRWTTVTVTAVSAVLALLAFLVYRWIRGRRRPGRWVDGGATNPW
ncbi:PD40 domain-containing protein [Dactylosporangium aurantiacum]|uniref:PD40 domain-containing protein n=1 Tax=Dactylosporangium aurantiacum TaxID=35754 RepID=A0A9Q9IAH1_9ACTN|nr:PD40 domain-containing protein [Dactylosporangium aurantiacum]MDG6107145.1 PD40 domain-containing protein [Dactylosporangium aurantiacum]UWZ51441.1 PD40 domain-containing protein [Dactylosporangium aurantiacum]